MGFDIFSNNSNSESLEKSRLYLSQIPIKSISIKRSFSKDLKIPKTIKKNYLEKDKEKNIIEKSISSKNILEKNKNQKEGKIFYKYKSNHKNYSTNREIKLNKEVIKHNTIFIFDWDDTLFFTTHLDPTRNSLLINETPKEKKMVESIEYYVQEILNKALSKGTVLIITNSSEGWVETCTYSYYPNLVPLLDKINIISARSLYEKKFPLNPLIWKIKAFDDLKEKFNFENCLLTNIICIGDDNSEIIAAKKLSANFDKCIIKTIKLRESPKLKELIKQLILVDEQILRIYSYPKSLTIQVDKMKNPKNHE